MTGKNCLLDVWPSLELYIHGGVSFTPYREQFNKLIGGNINYLEMYNASEGFFAAQDYPGEDGMLLFTNHGELARRLTHPSFEIPRTYAVRVLGTVDEAVIGRWKAGIELDDGVARFEKVERGGASGAFDDEGGESANQWFTVSVREGRNRLVRRLIESQDLQVSRLIRISYGPIELGRGIKSGTAREASPAELLAVLDAVGLSEAKAGLEPPRRGPHGGRPGASPASSAPSAPARRGKPARAAYRAATASRSSGRPEGEYPLPER